MPCGSAVAVRAAPMAADLTVGNFDRKWLCKNVVGDTPRGPDRHIFSMRKANEREKHASHAPSKSDLARVDKHIVKPEEYEDLPEITDEMLARAKVNKGGRPVSPNPRKLISLRLPADLIERWKETGPGWQPRMAERLSKVR